MLHTRLGDKKKIYISLCPLLRSQLFQYDCFLVFENVRLYKPQILTFICIFFLSFVFLFETKIERHVYLTVSQIGHNSQLHLIKVQIVKSYGIYYKLMFVAHVEERKQTGERKWNGRKRRKFITFLSCLVLRGMMNKLFI